MKYTDVITLGEREITKDTVVYIILTGENKFGLFAISKSYLKCLQKNKKVEPFARATNGWILPNSENFPKLFDEQGVLKVGGYLKEDLEKIGIYIEQLPDISFIEVSPKPPKYLKLIDFILAKENNHDALLILQQGGGLTTSRSDDISQIINRFDKLELSYALYVLKQQGCLTSQYIDLVIHYDEWRYLIGLLGSRNVLNPALLKKLYDNKQRTSLLSNGLSLYERHLTIDEKLINYLLKNPQYTSDIACGLARLEEAKISAESDRALILKHKHHASSIGNNFAVLHKANLLNDKNRKKIINSKRKVDIWHSILQMKKIGGLTQESFNDITKNYGKDRELIASRLESIRMTEVLTKEETKILHWTAPKELQSLANSLNKMFSYGIIKLSESEEKGLIAMKLALALKLKLKEFLDSPLEVRQKTKSKFQKEFLELLTSENDKIGRDVDFSGIEWLNIIVSVGYFLLTSLALIVGVYTLDPELIATGAVGTISLCTRVVTDHNFHFFSKFGRKGIVDDVKRELPKIGNCPQ